MMMHTILVYEIILFIYGISIVFYIIDMTKSHWPAHQVATGMLALAWFMQSFLLIYEIFFIKNFPVLTLNEGIYFYGWLLLTISLIMNRIFPVRFIVFFTNLFSFCMFWLSMSLHSDYQVMDKGVHLQHEVLIAHIAFTIIAYGFLTISFFLAMMYLIQYRILKKKQGFRWLWRLSDLTQLDRYSFSFVKLGVPFLFLGLLLGVLWGYMSVETFYWIDMKTIGSISVFLVYLIYLIMRWTRGYKGRSSSILNSATFLVLLVNFFLFNVLSNFHF